MTWWESWFGEEYLELYPHRDVVTARREVDFVLSLLPPPTEPLLDLCCGTGRHAVVFAERGIVPVGLDFSLSLLETAHDRGRRLRLVRGDMRRVPFADATFGAVVNFFTSFGYFLHERDNASVLAEVARVLRRRGALLCDTFNRGYILPRLVPEETHCSAGKTIRIRRFWDPGTQRVNKEIRIEHEGSSEFFRESVRAYSPEELLEMARGAGFGEVDLFGDFDGSAFCSASPRMILFARRAA